MSGQGFDQLVRNHTPASWQAEQVSWHRDVLPQNGIDDLIDQDAGFGVLHDIVVNYSKCTSDVDIAILDGIASPSGHVQMRLKYITSVAVGSVTYAAIEEIVALPDVAFVEMQGGFGTTLEVSVPTVCVTSPGGCTGSVESNFPGIDGSGVNIVIMDSGVDNTLHQTFAATPFIAGYDALTQTFVDPDDDQGHGTHVVSIALGQGAGSVSRGVAPAAGLIDVRIFDSNTFCNTAGQWTKIVDALEVIYDNRVNWGVNIINMSFRQCSATQTYVPSDGTDAFSQLVDLAESMGILTVAAAGNNGPNNTVMATPSAATRALTVAASFDQGTVSRADHTISIFSARGPRQSDGDFDDRDELKPEVTAPGEAINAARHNTLTGAISFSGTSMAAPHVAGIAALIMQSRPGINVASVRNVLISTADPRGTPTLPAIDPVWNNRWGWGLVNALAAISVTTDTDLSYPSHPPSPSWLSPDISTTPLVPIAGQQATVHVDIINNGPNPAFGAEIQFGVHVFSASTPTFHDIGKQIVNLPVGTTTVSMNWTPAIQGHQCLQVEIGYGPDTNYTNNQAQRNITVTSSPVEFQVQNTIAEEPVLVEFATRLENTRPFGLPWTVTVDPPFVVLAANDCPQRIVVNLERPVGAPVGELQIAHVEALATPMSAFADAGEARPPTVSLGGISVFDYAFVDCEQCLDHRLQECLGVPPLEREQCEDEAITSCVELYAPRPAQCPASPSSSSSASSRIASRP